LSKEGLFSRENPSENSEGDFQESNVKGDQDSPRSIDEAEEEEDNRPLSLESSEEEEDDRPLSLEISEKEDDDGMISPD
jgi:hypothetical protein